MNSTATEQRQYTVPTEAYGQRLDQVLVNLLPEFSRSRLQQWVKQGKILLNGQTVKSKTKVTGGETLDITIEQQQQGGWYTRQWVIAAVPYLMLCCIIARI